MTESLETPPRTAAEDSGRGGRVERKTDAGGRRAPRTEAQGAGLQVADVMMTLAGARGHRAWLSTRHAMPAPVA